MLSFLKAKLGWASVNMGELDGMLPGKIRLLVEVMLEGQYRHGSTYTEHKYIYKCWSLMKHELK